MVGILTVYLRLLTCFILKAKSSLCEVSHTHSRPQTPSFEVVAPLCLGASYAMRPFLRALHVQGGRICGRRPWGLASCLSTVKKIREMEPNSSGGGNLLENAARFHDVADATLEQVMQLLTPLESEQEDVDIMCSQGVLNINLGARGMWVINKQTPNRQLWWSSPLSGPRRYEYRPSALAPSASAPASASLRPEPAAVPESAAAGSEVSKWRGTVDGADLLSLLHAEVKAATGVDILAS